MKALIIAFVFLVSTSSPFYTLRAQSQNNDYNFYMNEIVKISSAYEIPSIQLAFKNNNQTLLFENNLDGYQNNNPKGESVFQAASLSKPLFAYIIMKMSQRGEIDIDKPLVSYTSVDRFTNKEWASKITARMVLQHNTGLPNWATSPSSAEWPQSVVEFLFKPDSAFSYSGEGFFLLQRAIEDITGSSLQQIAKKEVFVPLKMHSSSFEWGRDDIKELDYDTLAAEGYNRDGENRGQGRHPRANSAYTLRTTAKDYSIFLSHYIAKEIFLPAVNAIRYPGKARECDNYIFWGLGTGIEIHPELGNIYFHWGDNGNFKALYIVVPSKDSHLVYFTNSAKGHDIIDSVISLFFGPGISMHLSSWINSK